MRAKYEHSLDRHFKTFINKNSTEVLYLDKTSLNGTNEKRMKRRKDRRVIAQMLSKPWHNITVCIALFPVES